MNINAQYMQSEQAIRKTVNASFDKGWLTTNTLEGVITHEFGHAVYFDMKITGKGRSLLKTIGLKREGGVAQALRLWEKEHKAAGDTISGYAKKGGPLEAFAEGFAQQHNNLMSTPYSKSVKILVDTAYPGGKRTWKIGAKKVDITTNQDLANEYNALLATLRKSRNPKIRHVWTETLGQLDPSLDLSLFDVHE